MTENPFHPLSYSRLRHPLRSENPETPESRIHGTKTCLKIIGFLETEKISAIFTEKRGKGFFSTGPTVRAVICQSKTQIER